MSETERKALVPHEDLKPGEETSITSNTARVAHIIAFAFLGIAAISIILFTIFALRETKKEKTRPLEIPCAFTLPYRNWTQAKLGVAAECPAFGKHQPCSNKQDCRKLVAVCAPWAPSLSCKDLHVDGAVRKVCAYVTQAEPFFHNREGFCNTTEQESECALCTSSTCHWTPLCLTPDECKTFDKQVTCYAKGHKTEDEAN